MKSSNGRHTLCVDQEYAVGGTFTIGSLTGQLFGELEQPICSGCFSYRARTYVPFTEEDREFIESSRSA